MLLAGIARRGGSYWPREAAQSLRARLRAGGSASGPMPVVYDAIPDDDCILSVYPMIPSNKEIAADLPKWLRVR